MLGTLWQAVRLPSVETSRHAPARRTTDDESGAKRRIWYAPEKRRDESRRCRQECLRHDFRGSFDATEQSLCATSRSDFFAEYRVLATRSQI